MVSRSPWIVGGRGCHLSCIGDNKQFVPPRAISCCMEFVSGAARGGGRERGEISPPSEILGAHFRFKLLITAIFHGQNSMKINTTCF